MKGYYKNSQYMNNFCDSYESEDKDANMKLSYLQNDI